MKARLRSALDRVRDHGSASLGGVRRSVERLRTSDAAERLGSALETRRVVRKAEKARERGNPGLACRLLEPEARSRPDDPAVVIPFFEAALECGRAAEAVEPMLRLVRGLAARAPERAAELWVALRGAAPDGALRADPRTLLRIAPALAEAGHADAFRGALRQAAAADASELSPGLLVRVTELAHGRDPATALRAARRALEDPALDASRRAHLEDVVASLEALGAGDDPACTEPVRPGAPAPDDRSGSAAPPGPPPARSAATTAPVVELAADDDEVDLVVGDGVEALDTPASGLRVIEAMPTALTAEGLGLRLLGARRARVAFERIREVELACIERPGGAPLLVIDLLLGEAGAPARVLRLRSDGFDPRMVVAGGGDRDAALLALVAALRSGGAASASAPEVRRFPDLVACDAHLAGRLARA